MAYSDQEKGRNDTAIIVPVGWHDSGFCSSQKKHPRLVAYLGDPHQNPKSN